MWPCAEQWLRSGLATIRERRDTPGKHSKAIELYYRHLRTTKQAWMQ